VPKKLTSELRRWHRLHELAVLRGVDEDEAVRIADSGVWPERLGPPPEEL
jgi:hypothetical protein